MTDKANSAISDSRLLRLAVEDNIVVAKTTIPAGETICIEGLAVALAGPLPTGHKIAAALIAAGEKVVKYGAPIGSAIRDIRPGEYVHTHNVKSDYLPTFTIDGNQPYLRDEESCKGI
jgi:altronate dehydratase small subunit